MGSCAWLSAQVPAEPPRSEASQTIEKATGQEVLLDLIARDTATTDGLDAGAYQLRAVVKQGDTQVTKLADVRIEPK